MSRKTLRGISLGLAVTTFTAMVMTGMPVKTMAGGEKDLQGKPYIVEEDISMRGEYEKHFINSDGTYTAVSYEKPVHLKENGSWKEIDNTLTEDNEVLKNGEGIIDVEFANGEETKLVKVEKDGYSISWNITAEDGNVKKPASNSVFSAGVLKSVNNAGREKLTFTMKGKKKANIEEDSMEGISAEEKKTVAKKLKSAVSYEELFGSDIDIKYTVLSDSVKEDIILNEPTDIDTFVMELSLKGLIPRIQNDNSIIFTDKNGENKFVMPAPFMTDSAEGYSEDIEIELEENNGTYLLKMTPDRKWLDSSERQYPVTIDPTVSPVNTSSNVRDTYIYTGDSEKHNNETTMYVGLRNGKVNRPFIKFTTMPTIKGVVTSATMNVTATSGTSTYGDMAIYKVNGSWDSATITWSNQPTSLTYLSKPTRSGYNLSFNVTSAVKSWYTGNTAGTNGNNGFAIKYTNESYNDYNRFYTSESSGNRPVLSIVYDGTDDYANTYTAATTINCSDSLPGKINYGTDVDYFKFTPAKSGTYRFKSNGTTDTRISVYYYDSSTGSLKYVQGDNDSGEGTNFKLDVPLTAGKIYFLNVRGNSNTVTGAYVLTASMSEDENYSANISVTPVSEEALDAIAIGEAHYNSAPVNYRILHTGIINEEKEIALKGVVGAAAIGYDVAAAWLYNFLRNTGDDMDNFPVKRMLEEGTSTEQYTSFVKEMNLIMSSAEYFAIRLETISFSSKEEKDVVLSSSDGRNWELSLGTYRYWSNCKVYKSSDGVYTATVTFNIRDYYDWDPDKEYKDISDILNVAQEMLYNMNYIGIAKNFNTSGSATVKLKWTAGERIGSGAEMTIVN